MSNDASELRFQSSPCVIGCRPWCRKYFWEGQLLEKQEPDEAKLTPQRISWFTRFMTTHRRFIAMLIPCLIFHFCWWCIMIKYNLWHHFKEKYKMSITMVFGSVIAGMTSEGGSSVAFPVMTLAFGEPPSLARDFSFMIQACGMVAAAFSIIFMKVKLEWRAMVFCSIGGVAGNIFGLEMIDPILSPEMKTMGFAAIWFSFAFSLLLLNLYHKRKTYQIIPEFGVGKSVILIATGFTGGIFTSFTGSGIDICSFSMLTLLFRITEKVATPTSVVLMAGNTLVGFFWRHVMMRAISDDAWEYLAVCLPIVVIGAPLGSVIGSHFHRHVLASFCYITDTAVLISAFCRVKQTKILVIVTLSIILFGFAFYISITKVGEWLMKQIERRRQETIASQNQIRHMDLTINCKPESHLLESAQLEDLDPVQEMQ